MRCEIHQNSLVIAEIKICFNKLFLIVLISLWFW